MVVISSTDAGSTITACCGYETSFNYDIARRNIGIGQEVINIATAPDARTITIAAGVEFPVTADGQCLAFWDMDARVESIESFYLVFTPVRKDDVAVPLAGNARPW